MERILAFCATNIWGVAVPLLLFLGGGYYLVRLRAFPFRHPIASLRLMLSPEEGEAGVPPVRALALALAGTLGIGNIAGVGVAIATGGAGAVFWMWVSALVAMMLKYAEAALAVTYRVREGKEVRGGAMYYLRAALPGRAGKALAALFALLCLGNAYLLGGVLQANAIAECLQESAFLPRTGVGVFLLLLTLLAVWGGKGRLMTLAGRLVPLMTALYVGLCLGVLCHFGDQCGRVCGEIIRGAFTPAAAGGGVGGFLLSAAVRVGCTKGLLSNEAGCGTSPLAHATSQTENPVRQGLWGAFEVFVDTMLLCTLTAFVILCSFPAVPVPEGGGMALVIAAFAQTYGSGANVLVSLSVFFFAYATVLCWAHYGQSCLQYFTNAALPRTVFLLTYCVLLLPGALLPATFLWTLTDNLIGLMTTVNVLVLIKMAGRVQTLSANYCLHFQINRTPLCARVPCRPRR